MGLYERIKEVAKSKGYSINRLEKELGFARSSISKFNKNVPSTEKVKQIADFLNVPISDIVDEASSEPLNISKFATAVSKQISYTQADTIFMNIVKDVLMEQLKKDELDELNQKIKERLPRDLGMPKPNTIAAHFDGDEYTEDELYEIKQFAEFVKNKRKS